MTTEEITRLFARWRDAYVRRDSVALDGSGATGSGNGDD